MSKPKIDFGRYGFDQYQINEIKILMSLEGEELEKFIDAVGTDDALYGVTLLETAALAVLDEDTESMTEFPEARELIKRVRHA